MDRNRLSRQLKTLAIQAEAAWDRAVDGASEDLTAALARGEIPGVALEAATAAAMGEAMGAWEEAIAAAGRGDLRDAAYSLGIAAALGKEHGCDDPEQRALCLVREALGVDRESRRALRMASPRRLPARVRVGRVLRGAAPRPSRPSLIILRVRAVQDLLGPGQGQLGPAHVRRRLAPRLWHGLQAPRRARVPAHQAGETERPEPLLRRPVMPLPEGTGELADAGPAPQLSP